MKENEKWEGTRDEAFSREGGQVKSWWLDERSVYVHVRGGSDLDVDVV